MDKILSLLKAKKDISALALIKKEAEYFDFKTIESVFVKNYYKGKDLHIFFDRQLNIIHGKNGIGKSKFLTLLNAIFNADFDLICKGYNFEYISIVFNECNIYLTYQDIKYLSKLNNTEIKHYGAEEFYDKLDKDIVSINQFSRLFLFYILLKKLSIHYKHFSIVFDKFKSYYLSFGDADILFHEGLRLIRATTIFDINTHMDCEMAIMDGKYLQFQVEYIGVCNSILQNILKDESLTDNVKLGSINQYKDRKKSFINIVNEFIEDVDIIEEESRFFIKNKDGSTLFLNQLSLGQKTLLLILLTAYIQGDKHCAFFIDNPEIGMHISWQNRLIDSIRQINPNTQLVISTHSPYISEDKEDQMMDFSKFLI